MKYVSRTVTVKECKQLIPKYEDQTFEVRHIKIFDDDKLPENVVVESENTFKVSMPIEQFFNLGDKKLVE